MHNQISKQTKEEILEKVKHGEKVMDLASYYGISSKTIYNRLRVLVKPDISLMEWNKLKRENEDLKQIIGLVTLELERSKKIKVIKQANNKKLAGKLLGLDSRNIYHHRNKLDLRDQVIKELINKSFKDNPAYGHRRLAIDLEYESGE